MEYVLKTENLCKSYRSHQVLRDATMNVPKGSVYGLVGRNGAGKTTLMRLVCGLQTPTSGSYSLYGAAYNDPSVNSARKRTCAIIEAPSIYQNMTARENLDVQFSLLGMSSGKAADDLLELVGLTDTGTKKAGHFSLGMRQRLGIAVTLAGNPDFILLDEPINGLDPQGIVEIRELILKLNREKNITVLISSHILSELSLLATDYGFMDKGHIIKEISARELERSMRKSMRCVISSAPGFARAAEKLALEYEIISDSEALLFGNTTVTSLVEALSSEGCELITVSGNDESLESFFLDLIGGDGNV